MRIKLSTKFIIAIIFGTLFLGLLEVFTIERVLLKQNAILLRNELTRVAKDISRQVSGHILAKNLLEIKLLVNSYKRVNENIEYIFVLGSQGELLAHTFKEGFPEILKQMLAEEKHFGREIKFEQYFMNKELISNISVPIMEGAIGRVCIGFSQRSINKLISRGARYTVSVILIILLFTAGAGFIFSLLFITRPLSELMKMVKEIGNGNLSYKVRIKSGDELEELGKAFNAMALDLEKTTVSKNYVDSIISSMSDILVVFDINSRIITVNHAACKFLGYQEPQLLGKELSAIFPSAESAKEIEVRLTTEGGFINFEAKFISKFNTVIPVLISGALMKDKENKIKGILIIAKDISERKQVEQEMLGLMENLKEKNKELDNFTYMVSHDLKEPLRSINAFSVFLIQDYLEKLDEQGRHYLCRVKDNAVRMQQLIEDLLEFSRIERIKNPFEETQVRSIIEEAKFRLEYAIKQRDVQIIIHDNLPMAFCDRVRITQVFTNLISNAIKFTDFRQPVIEIGGSIKGDFCEFYVKDNGPGIEERYFKKIFEVFQRLQNKEGVEGTGIGLTIVQKIIGMHGGKVWLESCVGEGTIFYFTLPSKIRPPKKKIGEILIEKKLISEAEIKKALEEQMGGV